MEVDELKQLFEEKRHTMCHYVLGEDTVLMGNGFLGTAKGAVLTSMRAMALAREKYKQDRSRRIEKELQVSELTERAARRTAIAQAAANRFWEASWQRRAALAGVPVDVLKSSVRSLQERRATARPRTAKRVLRAHTKIKALTDA